jgi:hypothetical protein
MEAMDFNGAVYELPASYCQSIKDSDANSKAIQLGPGIQIWTILAER